MKQFVTDRYNKGIYSIIDPENIPTNAAQDSVNWKSLEDQIQFDAGRDILGTAADTTTAGGVQGILYSRVNFKEMFSTSSFVDIEQNYAFLKRVGRKLYFYKDDTNTNSGTWHAIPIVGTSNTDLFGVDEKVYMSRLDNEYQSLAGRFIYIIGQDTNIYKIDPYSLNNPSTAFVTQCYVPARNFLSNGIYFDKSRSTIWARKQDKTGRYFSNIDPQGANYTTVTSESHAISANTPVTGVATVNTRLTAAAADNKRHVFGLLVTTPIGTFRDDKQGGFVDVSTNVTIPRYDPSATGATVGATITYNTGLIQFSFHPSITGNITVDYQWEDPTDLGVLDFRFSIPRLTGEGDIVRQDAGADPILAVIPYRGVDYSLKASSAYQLTLTATGDIETNTIFARNLGIPNGNCAIATDLGIIYMDTSDRTFPRLKILKNLEFGGVIQPEEIAKHFRFADFDYTYGYFEIYNNNVLISCRSLQQVIDGGTNDTILFYDLRNNAISKYKFRANNIVQGESRLFGGDTITSDAFLLFETYANGGEQIENYWTGKAETYDDERLKKFKWLRVKGRIDENTKIKIYADYDNSGQQWIGTILGNGTYVDISGSYTIGSNPIGTITVGGQQDILNSLKGNPFFCEIKVYTPKYRSRSITYVAEGFGYASIDMNMDMGIRMYEQRMPNKYRSKQYVPYAGEPQGQQLPPYQNIT